jgi:uncharacterized protein (TIGR00725 family)
MSGPVIAVCGTGFSAPDTDELAEEAGRLLAQAGATIVCGGHTGVMEAVCRGAKESGGTTVGILPGDDRHAANRYIDVAIATGMGEMRNALIVRSADAVIAIGGGPGTLSEIAFALKIGVPVVGLRTWELDGARLQDASFTVVDNPSDAVERALDAAGA